MCGAQKVGKVKVIRRRPARVRQLYKSSIGLAKENSLMILFILGKTRDSYLDTKKPLTSKTDKKQIFRSRWQG